MPFLGWGWVFYQFEVCETLEEATRFLVECLRSEHEMVQRDREDLARLIEQKFSLSPSAKFTLSVVPRRANKRNFKLKILNGLIERVGDYVDDDNMNSLDASIKVIEEFKIEKSTMKKEYFAQMTETENSRTEAGVNAKDAAAVRKIVNSDFKSVKWDPETLDRYYRKSRRIIDAAHEE
jgi:hypothetical protein